MPDTSRGEKGPLVERAETKEDVFKEVVEFVEGLEVGTPEFEAFQDYVNRYNAGERRVDCIQELVFKKRQRDGALKAEASNQDVFECALQEAESDLRLVEDATNRVLARVEERVGADVPYTRAMAKMRKFQRRMDNATASGAGVNFEGELKKLLEIKYESL